MVIEYQNARIYVSLRENLLHLFKLNTFGNLLDAVLNKKIMG
jgi:hypothetical protein